MNLENLVNHFQTKDTKATGEGLSTCFKQLSDGEPTDTYLKVNNFYLFTFPVLQCNFNTALSQISGHGRASNL